VSSRADAARAAAEPSGARRERLCRWLHAATAAAWD
jgi:hypothetical protein